MTSPVAPHALVVGGTGMLAGAVGGLVARGWRVSLLSRRARAFAAGRPGLTGFDCDYDDEAAFAKALDEARRQGGPIELAVGWFHTLKPTPDLAARVGEDARPGRLFHVLGSAMADPARPDRLERARADVAGAAHCAYRQVILGFVLQATGARWLTHAEISMGLLAAIDADMPLAIIGVTEPWSARP